MNRYIRVVFFTLGLAVMICVGAINALLMTPRSEWFTSLVGMRINGTAHAVCWLCIYLLFAVHIGEMCRNKSLSQHLWILFSLIFLSTVWCGFFFRLHRMVGATGILCICAVLAVTLFVVTAKKTRLLALFSAPILSWYLYLLVVNVYLAVVN